MHNERFIRKDAGEIHLDQNLINLTTYNIINGRKIILKMLQGENYRADKH